MQTQNPQSPDCAINTSPALPSHICSDLFFFNLKNIYMALDFLYMYQFLPSRRYMSRSNRPLLLGYIYQIPTTYIVARSVKKSLPAAPPKKRVLCLESVYHKRVIFLMPTTFFFVSFDSCHHQPGGGSYQNLQKKVVMSVHFKNTVARSSVHSKLWLFSIIHKLTLFWCQLM